MQSGNTAGKKIFGLRIADTLFFEGSRGGLIQHRRMTLFSVQKSFARRAENAVLCDSLWRILHQQSPNEAVLKHCDGCSPHQQAGATNKKMFLIN
jgi:hypothetical protein